jgi:hypothetical protein
MQDSNKILMSASMLGVLRQQIVAARRPPGGMNSTSRYTRQDCAALSGLGASKGDSEADGLTATATKSKGPLGRV